MEEEVQKSEPAKQLTWGDLGFQTPPTHDAGPPRVVGSREQRLQFATQVDLEDVYDGCAAAGLRVVGVEGQRVYGGIVNLPYKGKDGVVRTRQVPFGTARPYTGSDPDLIVAQLAGEWVSDEEVAGGYRVTVMRPR